MNFDLLVKIIFFGSLSGMLVFIYLKLPVLVALPESSKKSSNAREIWLEMKKIAGRAPILKTFSFELFLQKVLSRIRILTLKAEHKTANWLQKLREKTNSRNQQPVKDDNYWLKLKKITKKRGRALPK